MHMSNFSSNLIKQFFFVRYVVMFGRVLYTPLFVFCVRVSIVGMKDLMW